MDAVPDGRGSRFLLLVVTAHQRVAAQKDLSGLSVRHRLARAVDNACLDVGPQLADRLTDQLEGGIRASERTNGMVLSEAVTGHHCLDVHLVV